MTLRIDRGIAYEATGKSVDVYRRANAESDPVMLLWHGRGPDERTVLEPLARATAVLGVVVFVPDWRSDAPDGGRAHLLASIAFVRAHAEAFGGDPHRVLLAGWSLGARAASGVAVDVSAADGWRPSAVACLATGFDRPTLTSASVPREAVARGDLDPVPFWLLHGTDDERVDVKHSREFAEVLRDHSWPVRFHELETNHAGIVMTRYDPGLGRCVPATDGHALEAGRRVAGILARAAGETARSGVKPA
ncbi:alpha/beta hydrolase [Microbispora sp. CA-135349]|uniref:alpha/beta hydrolase n=1 Tax=Microbispora sp. CA-135349 TaxID=3239953 RepID=UPI003D93DDF2